MKRSLWVIVLLCIAVVANVYFIERTSNTVGLGEATSGSFGPPVPIPRISKQQQQQQLPRTPTTPATPTTRATATETTSSVQHRVAGLSCHLHGGPSDEDAAEMIYWRDIPADATLTSPFQNNTGQPSHSSSSNPKYYPKYLTFEPDEGGFNNVRIATETAIALSISMGRILVIPPSTNFYLLSKCHRQQHGGGGGGGEKKEATMSLSDFFHLDSVEAEHNHNNNNSTTGTTTSKGGAFQSISMQEFLQREALTGKIRDTATGTVTFPPNNRTDWNGIGFNWDAASSGVGAGLWQWLRQSTVALDWGYGDCVASFPNGPDSNSLSRLQSAIRQILEEDKAYEASVTAAGSSSNSNSSKKVWLKRTKSFDGHPIPVDSPVTDRLREMLANRKGLCIYNETLQQAKVIHLKGDQLSGHRVLVHFYAFLFFEDWRRDLYTKRFVRDHLRYNDLIQCAAARVVQAMREVARRRYGSDGTFDSLHVRRGDFQFKEMILPVEELYEKNLKSFIREKRTLFIATDERNTSYFDILRDHYHIYFLRDFEHLLVDVNPNFFGMIDQLVASRGETFVGTYFSTFSGYINRLRGYHSQNNKDPGYEHGIIRSFYFGPKDRRSVRRVHRTYRSIRPNFWQEEFPAGWRMIDYDSDEMQ